MAPNTKVDQSSSSIEASEASSQIMDSTNFCNLDEEDPSEKLSFNLYENTNHEATQQSGSLKSYEVKEQGGAIYDSRKSGHSVTVERLLWVDGWERSIMDGENTKSEQEMTLVVLKITLEPENKKKFWYMKASLSFEDMDKNGVNGPQVQAWAPFKKLERWNPTMAHYTKSGKKKGSVEVSHSVASATAGWSRESGVSWDQMVFGEGRAKPMTSKTGNRNGVYWVVQQNNLQKDGVPPELWVAVLLSRPTAEPYLVRFEIDARVGTMDDLRNKTRRFFDLGPDKTKPFMITPWYKEVCYQEGRDIRKLIDINNLNKLRSTGDSCMLDMKWGPSYQVEATAPERPGSSWATTDLSKDSQSETSPASKETLANTATLVEEPVIPVAAESIQLLPQLNLPPLVVGWHSPGLMPNLDSNRLTGLEERMARLESRLHEQDSTIIALQQKLLEKGRGWRS